MRASSIKNGVQLLMLLAVLTGLVACGGSSSSNRPSRSSDLTGEPDKVKPVIKLKGKAIINLLKGADYQDAGAVATDNIDGDITPTIIVTGKVNTHVIGTYKLHYNVKDKAGNSALELSRVIHVSTPNPDNPKISTIEFESIDIAKNNVQKSMMRISPKLTVTFDNGKSAEYPLQYDILAVMGDEIGNEKIGRITDKAGMPILDGDGSEIISNSPDGNSLIHVGDKDYLITNFEARPGSLYKTEVQLVNGKLRPINTMPVDLKSIGGTIINCASTKTNYGSHLAGEENFALNSRYADSSSPFYKSCSLNGSGGTTGNGYSSFCSYVDSMANYLKDTSINASSGYNGATFSPYNYGNIIEVQPQADGTTKVAKHRVMGRYTPELAIMMPDNKTVYSTDDGTFKGFWKFVSDTKITSFKANWEGTLYAAKVQQTSAENGGKFNLSWVKLGHAKDSEIQSLADSKMKLTDIFSIESPNTTNVCPDGFKAINEDNALECLKLVAGQEKAAAFLETRKYAAYLGATIEFRKEEGITYNPDKNVLYVAMTEITQSMEDNFDGKEKNNAIRLPKNSCGAVYEITLDDNYSGTKMEAVITGKPLKEGEAYSDEWYCHPNAISNPDNLRYLGYNTLLVSEDTTKHVNNMMWAYNTVNKTLTRIASLPIGAEVTGVDMGTVSGKEILLINTQHPFQDNPRNRLGDTPNSSLLDKALSEQRKAKIGYITGFPETFFNVKRPLHESDDE